MHTCQHCASFDPRPAAVGLFLVMILILLGGEAQSAGKDDTKGTTKSASGASSVPKGSGAQVESSKTPSGQGPK